MMNQPRYLKKDYQSELITNYQMDELMALEHEVFSTSKDFVAKAHTLIKAKYQNRDSSEVNYLYVSSLAFFYQKLDQFYHEEYLVLTSLSKINSPEISDLILEKESKQRIKELLQCEQAFEELVNSGQGSLKQTPFSLISLLEVLFDDPSSLDLLIILLFQKFTTFLEEREICLLHQKLLYFMTPYLRLLQTNNLDIMKVFKNRDELLRLEGKMVDYLCSLLNSACNTSTEEAKTLKEQFEKSSGSIENKKRVFKTIRNNKESFKREAEYFEALGVCSAIILLWTASQETPTDFSFLKMGSLTHLYAGKYLLTKNNKVNWAKHSSKQYFEILNTFSFALSPHLIKDMLDYVLSEIEGGSLENNLLQCLEVLLWSINQFDDVIEFEEKYEFIFNSHEYIESLVTKFEERNNRSIWDRLFDVLYSNSQKLYDMKSNILASSSALEVLLCEWCKFVNWVKYTDDWKVQRDGEYYLQPKYLKIYESFLKDILKLLGEKTSLVLQLSRKFHLDLIDCGRQESPVDKTILNEIDLFGLFEIAEIQLLTFFKRLEGEKEENSQILSFPIILEAIAKWIYDLRERYELPNEMNEILQNLLESKACKIFLESLKRKTEWFKRIESPDDMKYFLSFLTFWIKMAEISGSYIEEGEKFEAFKFVLEDLVNLDYSKADPKQVQILTDGAFRILQTMEFFTIHKEKKILFAVVNLFLLRQKFSANENDQMIQRFFRKYMDKDMYAKDLVQICEIIFDNFTLSFKDPRVDCSRNLFELMSSLDKKEEAGEVAVVEQTQKEEEGKVEDREIEEKPEEKSEERIEEKPQEMKEENMEKQAVEKSGEIKKTNDQKEFYEKLEKYYQEIHEKEVETDRLRLMNLAYQGNSRAWMIYYKLSSHISQYGERWEACKDDLMRILEKLVLLFWHPVMMFSTPYVFMSRSRQIISDLLYNRNENVGVVIQAFCKGFNSFSKGFDLANEETVKKMDIKRICRMLSNLNNQGFVPQRSIPNDINWTEAAFVTMFFNFKMFKEVLNGDFYPPFGFSDDFNNELKEAFSTWNKISHIFSKHIADNLFGFGDAIITDEKWWNLSEEFQRLLEPIKIGASCWSNIFGNLLREKGKENIGFEAMKEEYLQLGAYLDNIDGLSSTNDRKSIALTFARVKVFLALVNTRRGSRKNVEMGKIIQNAECFKVIMQVEKQALKYLLENPERCKKSLSLRFLQTVQEFFIEEGWYDDDQERASKNSKEIVQVIINFVKDLDLLSIIQKKIGDLQMNMDKLFNLFTRMFRVYQQGVSYNITNIEKRVAKILQIEASIKEGKEKKNAATADSNQKKEEDVDFDVGGLFGEEPDEENETVVAQEAVLEVEVEVKVEEKKEETEVKVDGKAELDEEKKENMEELAKTKEEEEKTVRTLEREGLEKEIEELKQGYRDAWKQYLDLSLPHSLYFQQFAIFQASTSTYQAISDDYWRKEYDMIYKKTLEFFKENVDRQYHEKFDKEIESIEGDTERLKPLERTSSKAINDLMTADFYYQYLRQFTSVNKLDDLKMSETFMMGYIKCLNVLFKRLLDCDFASYKKEVERFSFRDNIVNIMNYAPRLAVQYIVAHISKNYCQIGDEKSDFHDFLTDCLELADLSVKLVELFFKKVNKSLLNAYNKYFDSAVSLTIAVLRADKSLRVVFLNKGMLERLLKIEKSTASSGSDVERLMILFAVLLEESIPMVTQAELKIMEDLFEQEGDGINNKPLELRIATLFSSNSNFEDFGSYEGFMQLLKNYDLKFNSKDFVEKELTQFTGEHFVISCDSEKKYLHKKEIPYLKEIQQKVSPVAQKSLELLMKTLIGSCLSDENAVESYSQKMTAIRERSLERRYNQINKFKILTEIADDEEEEEDESDIEEEDCPSGSVKNNEESRMLSKKKIPLKEASIMIATLSSIMNSNLHLIPFIIFQKVKLEDYLSFKTKEEKRLELYFKNIEEECSLFDIIVRIVIWRDGIHSLYLIGSLFTKKYITTQINNKNNEEENIDVRYVILSKLLNILEDIIETEQQLGEGLKTFESLNIRSNIGRMLGQISKLVRSYFPKKIEEIYQRIVEITQKLFGHIERLAECLNNIQVDYNLLDIIKLMTKDHLHQLSHDFIKENYLKILKALEEEGDEDGDGNGATIKNNKEFMVNLNNKFKELEFALSKDTLAKTINAEDQKPFEMWDEKEIWEKQETKKFLVYTKLRYDENLVQKVSLAFDSNTQIAGNTSFYNFLRNQHIEMEEMIAFYKGYGKRFDNQGMKEMNKMLDFFKYSKDNSYLATNLGWRYSPQFIYEKATKKLNILETSQEKINELKVDKKFDLFLKEYQESIQKAKAENTEAESESEKKIEENEKDVIVSTPNQNEEEKSEKIEEPRIEKKSQKEIERELEAKLEDQFIADVFGGGQEAVDEEEKSEKIEEIVDKLEENKEKELPEETEDQVINNMFGGEEEENEKSEEEKEQVKSKQSLEEKQGEEEEDQKSSRTAKDEKNEEKKEQDKEEEEEEENNRFKHFVIENLQTEEKFRFRVNKLFRESRRFGEMINLEITMRKILKKEKMENLEVEKALEEYVKDKKDFEKNFIYVGLGKRITLFLSESLQEKIKKIKEEFEEIKCSFGRYQAEVEEILSQRKQKSVQKTKEGDVSAEDQPKQVEASSEEKTILEESNNKENLEEKIDEDVASEYDEFDYDDIVFLQEDGSENNHRRKKRRYDDDEEEEDYDDDEDEEQEEEGSEGVRSHSRRRRSFSRTHSDENDSDEDDDDDEDEDNADEDDEEDEDEDDEEDEEENETSLAEPEAEEADDQEKEEEEEKKESEDEEEEKEEVEEKKAEVPKSEKPKKKKKKAAVNLEVSEDIRKAVRAFILDDKTVLEMCKLFFAEYDVSCKAMESIQSLFSAFSQAPRNCFKILDTLLFVLYSPELYEENKLDHQELLDFPPKQLLFGVANGCSSKFVFQKAIHNILYWITTLMRSSDFSCFFLTPIYYLNKFGNKLLQDLKEKTNYEKKFSGQYSILDMVIGLLESKEILEDHTACKWIVVSVSDLLDQEKKIVVGKGDPNVTTLTNYQKNFSPRNISIIFNLMIRSSYNPKKENLHEQVLGLFSSFTNCVDLVIGLQSHFTELFVNSVPKVSISIEKSIERLRAVNSPEALKTVFEDFDRNSLDMVKLIMKPITEVLYLLTEDKEKKGKKFNKIQNFLKDMVENFFSRSDIQSFFVQIYELCDLYHKTKESLKLPQSTSLEDFIQKTMILCLYHYAIVIILNSEQQTPKTENPGVKSDNSLSEVDQVPKLSKLVSIDDSNSIVFQPLQRSFSQYKKQSDIDFRVLFANFGLKYSKEISSIYKTANEEDEDASIGKIVTLIAQKCPWVLDLQTKREIMKDNIRNYFDELDVDGDDERRNVQIDRKNVIRSTILEFRDQDKRDLLLNLEVEYKGEQGIDAGGPRREFFSLLTQELFDPNCGLFRLSENKRGLQPNPLSSIIPGHLMYFEFAGMMLAKAIADEIVLDICFTKSLLKHILGKEIAISDLEDVDAALGKNLQWILNNEVDELYLTFTHEVEIFGERIVEELQDGGFDTYLNEANKKDYVKKVSETRMTKEIEEQLKAFLKGFRLILPKKCLSHFGTGELEIIISGTPKIDLDDMKKHVVLQNYTKNSQIIKWFWEILDEFCEEEVAAFLYFASGSTKVPHGGFKEFPINITKCADKKVLPIAHTCNYEVEIPEYESRDILREKLLMAIFEGVDGFYIS